MLHHIRNSWICCCLMKNKRTHNMQVFKQNLVLKVSQNPHSCFRIQTLMFQHNLKVTVLMTTLKNNIINNKKMQNTKRANLSMMMINHKIKTHVNNRIITKLLKTFNLRVGKIIILFFPKNGRNILTIEYIYIYIKKMS